MRIVINADSERHELHSAEPRSISSLLEELDIPPSTVLVIHAETIIPHDTIVRDDVELDLIVVSSGG
jgi:sulfur carrier protein ThiS